MYHIPQEMYVRVVWGKSGEGGEEKDFLCFECNTNSPKNQYDIFRRRYDEGAMAKTLRRYVTCFLRHKFQPYS
jgi:hypothetical protein